MLLQNKYISHLEQCEIYADGFKFMEIAWKQYMTSLASALPIYK